LILAKLVSMFGCSVVHKLSADFRAATKIVTVFYKPPVKPGHILIKVLYAGVNASDVSPLVESYICLPTVAVIFFFRTETSIDSGSQVQLYFSDPEAKLSKSAFVC
jgi:hypothetical protein